MAEWNAYADGRYLGTVNAVNEDDARCAALSKFDVDEDAAISVSRR